MHFDVEVDELTPQQESLLLDRIIETIKDFGVTPENFRIFLDENEEESEND